ncbi:hypothetical protein F2Q70_00043233 [Brassica cretica]|uniref:Uncharacterized protein n=1 Tax=Brassica cretica TaxID=69181 RepID=A0A8S9KBA2_BRACR|nr:hypothetical protein F2Q70_00043233 [Brassica cretica]
MHGLMSYRRFGRARLLRSDRAEQTFDRYVATEQNGRSVATVFDTMPRDVRDQCAGFRARPKFTPGFRGCDD